MKKRLLFIASLFAALWAFFILQKPVFMLYNDAVAKGFGFSDFMDVMFHGASLDSAVVGYLVAVPWLVTLVSIFFRKFPLRKILLPYYILISILVCIIFIVDMGLYPFWGFKLDASIFLYLDSPKNALASVSVGFIVLRTIAILVLAGLAAWALCRLTPRSLDKVEKPVWGTIATILVGGVLFIFIRGGVTESTSNIGQVYYCNNEFLNHSAINPAFSLLSSASKTADYAAEFNFFDEEKRQKLFSELYPVEGENEVELLNTKQPNLLIVLMEGFGGVFVESLGGLPGVAPNMERLSKEGVFFTNCYANSFRTDRGTVCTFSGYQSFPVHSVMKIPSKSRTLPSIAGKLVEKGYHTDFIYGGDINFTNMKSYLLGSGYQHLTADVDFSMSERQNPWGVNDDITFDFLLEKIKHRTDTPWHTAFLTLSSHEPFEVPYRRLDENIPNAFAFTDDCLGKFIDQLKQLPQWKDLLVVCLPDHGFYYPFEGLNHDPRIHHIPMLWLGGAIKEPMVIDKIMNQTDMAATLLAQLGISHKEFNFSRNVLGKEYTYPFAYYSYNNGFAFVDSTGATLVDNNSGRVLIDTPSPSQRRLELGKAILQSSHDDLGQR